MTSLWPLLCLIVVLFAEGVYSGFSRVCYYTSWSTYRRGIGRFTPENIDPHLCTHIIYAFASVNGNNIGLNEFTEEDTLSRVISLRDTNRYLKILLAVGGWLHGTAPFTALVRSKTKMDAFAKNAIAFLRKWNLDGLDLDWEYPGSRGSPPSDKFRFTQLVRILRSAFDEDAKHTGLPRLLLTAAVSISKQVVDGGYEIDKISKVLDFINLMAYDLHGSWDRTLGHNSPLYAREGETSAVAQLNQDWGVTYWLSNGAPPEKIMLGIATYGRTFLPYNGNQMGDWALGPGRQGTFTEEAGFLAYYEVCKYLQNGWTRQWHPQHQVPYAYSETEWVGYDDVDSTTIKAEYIKARGLGGAMVWAIDMDDFRGACGNVSNPLLRTIRDILSNDNTAIVPYVLPSVSRHTVDTADAPEYKRVCYYTNWSQHRSQPLTFLPENIDPELCTHVIFSFAKLEDSDIHFFEPNDDDLYRRVLALKTLQPRLMVLLAVGGWSHNIRAFSDMVATRSGIITFAGNANRYLRKHNFDGLDLDWKYPGSRGSKAIDKYRFTSLVKGLRQEFDQAAVLDGLPRLLLTAAVSAGRSVIDSGYEIEKLARYLDFINLMTYDLHGSWESVTGHNSPLYSHDLNSQDFAVRYWIGQGTPREKIMMGLGFYGRSFTLRSPTDTSLGAVSVGPGLAQPHTKTDGLMAYFEVCSLVGGGWEREWSTEGRAPYAFSGTQWVGYDDMESIAVKANYIRSKGLGGAMMWTVDMDDYSNVCGDGPYPLMNKLKEVLTSPYIPQLPNPHPHTTSKPRFSSLSTTSTLPTTASPPQPEEGHASPPPPQPEEGQTEERLHGATCGPPSVCPHGRYIPDVCNASVYYQCNFRIALTRVCPLGLVWNTVSQACDWHRADNSVTLKVKTQVIPTTEHKTGINVIPTFRTTVFIPRTDTTTPTPKTTIATKPRVQKDEDVLPTFRTTVFIPEAMSDTVQPRQQSNEQVVPSYRTIVDVKPRGIPTTTAITPQTGRQAITYKDCKPTSCPSGLLIADPCDQRCYYSCAEHDLAHHSCCPAPTVWNERIFNCDWSWSR